MRTVLPVVAMLLLLAGCGKKQAAEDPVASVEPAFRLTAEEYQSQAGDAKFNGQVIELTGTVSGVGRNISGESYVTLKAQGLVGVMCFTTDPEPWATVAQGQKVRIKGLWAPTFVAPRLLWCVVVEPGEYAAVRISAADLAKEYEADREATVKKYDKKHLVVTGEVTSKSANDVGAVTLGLKTGNATAINCSFTAFDKDAAAGYEVGQTVTVLGEFTLNFGSGNTVDLFFCLPLQGK
jgi:predicted small lipoprotein YifL